MNNHKNGVFWRGIAAGTDTSTPSPSQRERVLLLVGASGNRKHLAEHLRQRYEVMLPDDRTLTEHFYHGDGETPFDLAIVDSGGINRWRQLLVEARSHAQPVFLPAMLITSQKELPRSLQACGAHIDEFLLSPIDPSELSHRADMLLRARRQALTQSSRLAYITHHDQSSGLPNKVLFLDRLSQAIQDATVLERQVYCVVIHISLASILKSLGNHALEAAGQACSDRLQTLLGENYSLARLSTEEWGLMLRAGASTDDALEVFAKIQNLESTPIVVGEERVHVCPSVGIAIYPDDASTAHSLLDCAGAALARTEQASRPAFYSPRVQRQALSRIRTEAGLYEALSRNQFEVWFQPKVRLQDGVMVGVEALVRWRLSSGELVPPNNFIPVAEKTGLITQIDRWVLRRACEYLSEWQAAGHSTQVAVNISAQHLDMPDFVSHVEETLSHFNISPHLLELELTETALADLRKENLDKLATLRQSGVSIALDDFGTGYCSLGYLHRLPITTLKIDKCFVDSIATDKSNAAITQTIVTLARNFHLDLVAEGIETQEQLACLIDLGVETGQGYLFARPMNLDALKAWLDKPFCNHSQAACAKSRKTVF